MQFNQFKSMLAPPLYFNYFSSMKTILTLLLALGCTAASAQKLMIGLHGGMQFNGAPMGTGDNMVSFDNMETSPSPTFGGRLGLGLGKLQLGVGYLTTSLSSSYAQLDKSKGIPFAQYTANSNVQTLYLFLNLSKSISRLQIFYGINAGYVNFSSVKTTTNWNNKFFGTSNDAGDKGFCGGVQVGGRVGLYKGLGVFVEASGRYNSVSFPMQAYDGTASSLGQFRNGSFLSFPILSGIDYRL